jgi:hypothetical protein
MEYVLILEVEEERRGEKGMRRKGGKEERRKGG